jgi:hypothetical protein
MIPKWQRCCPMQIDIESLPLLLKQPISFHSHWLHLLKKKFFSPSMQSILETTNSEQRHTRAIVWEAILHAFPSIRGFGTDDINDPRNVLTLWDTMHASFGRLEFCLEPTVSFFLPSHLITAK